MNVKAKKHLGQHFLKDEDIASKIVASLQTEVKNVLEVGPGMGVLTKYLLKNKNYTTWAVEIDRESVTYLKQHYPDLTDRIISHNLLKMDFTEYFDEQFSVIGNFPYNISSQILFKVLENKNQVPEVVGMFQKEVAERIAAPPGSKTYGIISVLLQAWYDIEYLFTVNADVFIPPPKVQSAVIRLKRNENLALDCDEKFFTQVVKTSFNQRRKTLRNSLKSLLTGDENIPAELLAERPEQLSVAQFVELTNYMNKK